MNLNLGDLPTWVAAVGTIGTLGVALGQINTERQWRRQQEDKKRIDEHRAPAMLITAVIIPTVQPPGNETGDATPVCLINSALAPVYRLVAGIVYVQGDGPRTIEEILAAGQPGQPRPVATVSILPGGTSRIWIHHTQGAGIRDGRAGVEVAFTDMQGGHWIRRATGSLEELEVEPFEYYMSKGLHEPLELQYPEPYE